MYEIRVGGMLNPEEFVSALYLHNSPHKLMKPMLMAIAVLYFVGVIGYGRLHFSPEEMTVLLFPLLLLMLWRVIFYPDQVQAAFLSQANLLLAYEFVLNSKGLKMVRPNQDESLFWQDIVSVRGNRRLTLLYRSESEFFIVPHRWFTSKDDFLYFQENLLQH